MDYNYESVTSELMDYIKEKYKLRSETSKYLSKSTYIFGQIIANDLNNLAKGGEDVQTNNLVSILHNRLFFNTEGKIMEKLRELRINKKENIFSLLKEQPYVSKNHHFSFANEILQSSHMVPENKESASSDEDVGVL